MQGVETALLANDACGAPIPWLMCCPWLFFDGKLFHHMLARATTAKSLLDLCEHRFEYVFKVERMRQAVLEGLDVDYCMAPVGPPSKFRDFIEIAYFLMRITNQTTNRNVFVNAFFK